MKCHSTTRVKDAYPALYELSCKACKLDCNFCYNCELQEFLACTMVPNDCALKHNIKRSKK